jgi:hypothetical protein
MEYFDITQKLVDNLNQAVLNDSGKDFFEALGFNVYDCNDGRWELSGVHTKGGVEMVIMIDKEDWIDSFEEYYDCFDVDEEIRIYREDPYGSYCKSFTCRQSVDDFEDWENYIKELVRIAKDGGNYKCHKHLCHDSAGFVLIFPKIEAFKLEELDKLEDSELLDLYYSHSSEVLKLSLDEFADYFNRNSERVMNNYMKFIG